MLCLKDARVGRDALIHSALTKYSRGKLYDALESSKHKQTELEGKYDINKVVEKKENTLLVRDLATILTQTGGY